MHPEADALNAAKRRKSLVIVEYAETKPRANLARLLWDLAWPPGRRGVPALIVARGIKGWSDNFPEKPDKQWVRVLLIARAAGDWWDELAEKAETFREQSILENAKHMRLSALKCNGASFKQHYDEAIRAFSGKLNVSPPTARDADLHEDAPILVVHVAALVAVLGFEGLPPDQQDKLLSRLLGHEERYWQRSAESCGLSSLSRTARRQSVAELCLSGAATEEDAAELLKRVPDLAGTTAAMRRSVARWLQGLYPGKGTDGLDALRPHLLAEHLVVRELANRTFFNRALSDLPEDHAHHAFTVLGYAAQRDREASSMIREAVEANRDQMILPAISAAVETGGSLDSAFASILHSIPMTPPQLTRLSAAIPLESRSLNQTATVIRSRLVEASAAELRRIRETTASRKEIERRQDMLVELARVYEFSRKRGHGLPASFRAELLKALGRQQRALAGSGQMSKAKSISRKIAQIEAAKPPPN